MSGNMIVTFVALGGGMILGHTLINRLFRGNKQPSREVPKR